jgi:hypothetical protein
VIEYKLLAENGAMVSAADVVNILLREMLSIGKVDIYNTQYKILVHANKYIMQKTYNANKHSDDDDGVSFGRTIKR